MAETAVPQNAARARKITKLSMIVGLCLGLIAGLAAFYLTWTNKLAWPGSSGSEVTIAGLPDIAFVPLDPITISLGPAGRNRHLRFTAQVEVEAKYRADVELLKPRILDVLNSYLRALEPAELEAQGALVRLRAQMFRRIQMVTGEGRARDLLISEFVLN